MALVQPQLAKAFHLEAVNEAFRGLLALVDETARHGSLKAGRLQARSLLANGRIK